MSSKNFELQNEELERAAGGLKTAQSSRPDTTVEKVETQPAGDDGPNAQRSNRPN